MTDNQIDSSNLLTTLHESEPGISLEELQHFLANAPSKPNLTIRYSVAALSISAIAALLFFVFLSRTSNQVSHVAFAGKTPAAAIKQAPASFVGNESIAQSRSVASLNHKMSRSSQKNFITPEQIADDLSPTTIDACLSPSETSATPALSSDFTQPTLLCANTSAPVINDFGSNTTQASYPFYEK
jgi:hypothetical protein